jgi:hypothetical protein
MAVPLIAFAVLLVGGFLFDLLVVLPPVALIAFVLWLAFGDGDIGALLSSPWLWGPVAAIGVLVVAAGVFGEVPEAAPRAARRTRAAATPPVARERALPRLRPHGLADPEPWAHQDPRHEGPAVRGHGAASAR